MYNDPYGPRKATSPPLKGLEERFKALPTWACLIIIGLNALIVVFLFALLTSLLSSAFLPSQQSGDVTQVSTPTAVSTEASRSSVVAEATQAQESHYPPKMLVDLYALAAKGDAGAIHEFHSESVGLTGVCPQPKREVTVDPSVTGQQLAEDLLAYFYAQHLSNDCGSVVFAYHSQDEAGNGYTAGRVNLDVNGSKHELTLDIGGLGADQEYIVTY